MKYSCGVHLLLLQMGLEIIVHVLKRKVNVFIKAV